MHMKRSIILFIAMIFVLSLAHSQTSEEEFLYLTYGYKEQLLKGLDDKKGYYWTVATDYKFVHEKTGLPFLGGNDVGGGKFEFEQLFREGENAPCAIVAIYKEKENMEKRDGLFIPIPHPESGQEVLRRAKDYLTKEVKFKPEIRTQYILAMHKLAMHMATVASD